MYTLIHSQKCSDQNMLSHVSTYPPYLWSKLESSATPSPSFQRVGTLVTTVSSTISVLVRSNTRSLRRTKIWSPFQMSNYPNYTTRNLAVATTHLWFYRQLTLISRRKRESFRKIARPCRSVSEKLLAAHLKNIRDSFQLFTIVGTHRYQERHETSHIYQRKRLAWSFRLQEMRFTRDKAQLLQCYVQETHKRQSIQLGWIARYPGMQSADKVLHWRFGRRRKSKPASTKSLPLLEMQAWWDCKKMLKRKWPKFNHAPSLITFTTWGWSKRAETVTGITYWALFKTKGISTRPPFLKYAKMPWMSLNH